GFANGMASIIIALLAPILGSIADRGSARKRFLLVFAALGVVMSGSLYFVAQGQWQIAVALYVFAVVGFEGGNIFNDSLLPVVAPREQFDRVSALGYSLGYLGGGLLFLVNVAMTLYPEMFGLPDAATAVRVAFLSVAIWWALFTLPLILFVHEPRTRVTASIWRTVRDGFVQLGNTLTEVRRLRMVFLFLLAYWLYIDGVHTVIAMA